MSRALTPHDRCPAPGAPGVVYLRADSHRARERLARALAATGRELTWDGLHPVDVPGSCMYDAPNRRARFGIGAREVVPVTRREARAVLARKIPGVGPARIPPGAALGVPYSPRHKMVWPEFWPDAED